MQSFYNERVLPSRQKDAAPATAAKANFPIEPNMIRYIPRIGGSAVILSRSTSK
jgi:hypothetical protein